MGFDAFIEFIYSFFPMKQMERMRDAMSLSSDNREKDLETIRDSFETLLPWVGANFYYYRHLVPTVIRLIDRRQLEGVCCMFTSAYHEVQRQAPVHHFYQENYIPEGSKKGGVDYFSVIGNYYF